MGFWVFFIDFWPLKIQARGRILTSCGDLLAGSCLSFDANKRSRRDAECEGSLVCRMTTWYLLECAFSLPTAHEDDSKSMLSDDIDPAQAPG